MKTLNDKARCVALACEALSAGDTVRATELARRDYPFQPLVSGTRKFSPLQASKQFMRDGFIDRYSGTQLIYPGALRLLSRLMPTEFPAHPNWKMSESHILYWELFPTIDHVVPVARGGSDTIDNWATTSMVLNSAKAQWTLEELDWEMVPAGRMSEWDGLLAWFIDMLARHPQHLSDAYIKRWYRAARSATS